MNSQKLTIKEIILLACLCAEYYKDVEADSPFVSGFALPVYHNSLTDADKKLACMVYTARLGSTHYDWSLVISDAFLKHSHADIINCSSYLDWAKGENSESDFDNLHLSSLEDNASFFIDYDEIPFVLTLQELDEEGDGLGITDEYDLPDFAKAIEVADKNGWAIVFVDKRNCYDEDDTNPIIYQSK